MGLVQYFVLFVSVSSAGANNILSKAREGAVFTGLSSAYKFFLKKNIVMSVLFLRITE